VTHPIVIPDGYTREDLVKCVEREVRLRERAYPRWVAEGKMTGAHARAETEAMKAVLAVVRQLPATPPAQTGLFGEGGRRG
jgi:hypothetical protein